MPILTRLFIVKQQYRSKDPYYPQIKSFETYGGDQSKDIADLKPKPDNSWRKLDQAPSFPQFIRFTINQT